MSRVVKSWMLLWLVHHLYAVFFWMAFGLLVADIKSDEELDVTVAGTSLVPCFFWMAVGLRVVDVKSGEELDVTVAGTSLLFLDCRKTREKLYHFKTLSLMFT